MFVPLVSCYAFFMCAVLLDYRITSLTMDGAYVNQSAAEAAGLLHLYPHCFAHCLMLTLKDNQDIFPWIQSVIKLIRLITRNAILHRGKYHCRVLCLPFSAFPPFW